MRNLVLLRGAPGCGKSTLIKEILEVEQYTISPDNLRLLMQAPVLTETGRMGISQRNDKQVWELLFQVLETRMKRGDFTIIDATHTKTSDFNRYRELCDKYRYRCYCVDLTDVPLETCLERNKLRGGFKFVPESVIMNMYERFKFQKVPGWVKVIKPEEFNETFVYRIHDFSQYKNIHHIGDIHGCFDVLYQYFYDDHRNLKINEDDLYIFFGDYIDRGPQNAEVIEFLLEIMDLPNVILLEGNHEIHLRNWAFDLKIESEEFILRTRPELEEKGITKSEVRRLCRRFQQVAYYKYGEKRVLCTHGGLSCNPDGELIYVASDTLLKGVGRYEDMLKINEQFEKSTPATDYQIHGHRNIQKVDIAIGTPEFRTFNLEGQVEFGGSLRILVLDDTGLNKFTYINNTNFRNIQEIEKEKKEISTPSASKPVEVAELVERFRNNPKLIMEKKFGDISSFNFNRHVFKNKLWSDITTKARGLFINTKTNEVVARGYEKFFNIGEGVSQKLENLGRDMKFPINAYVKENGFLGMLGYDKETCDFVFATKSSLEGRLREVFIDIFNKTVDEKDRDALKNFLDITNTCLVFEVISPKHDPHIIKYTNEKIVLLDVIWRKLEFKKSSYENLRTFGKVYNFEVKEEVTKFKLNNWKEFLDFYQTVTMDNFQYAPFEHVEGFVIEDAAGKMVKIKCSYYQFWKHMRSIVDMVRSGKGHMINMAEGTNALSTRFISWVKTLTKEELTNIVDLRERFIKTLDLKDISWRDSLHLLK